MPFGNDPMIEIMDGIEIAEDELVFTASRSSGPGGQNVNKVSSRVSVLFDVSNCVSLSEQQRRRVLRRLASRVSKDGLVRAVSYTHLTLPTN